MKKLAWVFFLSLAIIFFLFELAIGKKDGKISISSLNYLEQEEIVVDLLYDSEATSREYKIFFKLLTRELRAALKKQTSEVRGYYQVFVVEFVEPNNFSGKKIFVLLEGNEDAQKTGIIHWQKIDRLSSAKIMRVFVHESVKKIMERLYEKDSGGGDVDFSAPPAKVAM